MTAEERRDALKGILEAISQMAQKTQSAVERTADQMEADAEHGVIVELLRGAPELIDDMARAPGLLVCYAALLAVEVRHDAGVDLRKQLNDVLRHETPQTTANHVRAAARVLLAAYADEPERHAATH